MGKSSDILKMKTPNEKIKYGILGCGKHALNTHAIPCKNVSNLELTSICDISVDNLVKFEKAYGEELKKFTDQGKFLYSDIEAVLIATPDEFHLDNLEKSIYAGEHILVEKPLATKEEELQILSHILDYASKYEIVVSSCHLRRFDPPFVWLKKNLSDLSEKYGKPINFTFDFSYHKPSKEWKHDRGLLLDHANHEIDLVNYLFGHSNFEAKKLYDSFDRYHLVGNRKDGINFEFQGTRRLDSRNYLEWAGIRFERGEVLLDTHRGTLRIHDHESNKVSEIEAPETDYELRGKLTLVNFANAIQGKEDCYLTHEDLFVNTATSVMLSNQDNWSYFGK